MCRILAEVVPAAGEPVEAVRRNHAYWHRAGHILRKHYHISLITT
jgi:hypothetical protein